MQYYNIPCSSKLIWPSLTTFSAEKTRFGETCNTLHHAVMQTAFPETVYVVSLFSPLKEVFSFSLYYRLTIGVAGQD